MCIPCSTLSVAVVAATVAVAGPFRAEAAPRPPRPKPHAAAHSEVELGVGALTVGVGLIVGHRFENGLRLEAGAGSAVLATGASLGVGTSFRLVDTGASVVEVPTVVHVIAGYLQSGLADECARSGDPSGCGRHPSNRLGVFALTTGVDWIVGGASQLNAFFVSARLGLGYLEAFQEVATGIVPVGQLGLGWTF